MRLRLFAKRPAQRGSAVVEAALVLALLAPLAVLAARYAWGFYEIQSLDSIVQESARFAASASLNQGEESWRRSVETYALCGSPQPCSRPRLPGLRPQHLRVELIRPESGLASVRVSVDGYSLDYPGGTRHFSGSPSAQFPRIEPLPN